LGSLERNGHDLEVELMERATIPSSVLRAGGALGLLWILPGCFTFQAIDPGQVTPGEEVQLVLSGPGTRGFVPSALMGETRVQGDLVGVTDDSVAVSVWIGEAYRGTPFEPVHQTYSFPRVELVRLERRQISKPRTILTTVGVLATIYVMIDRLGYLENPNSAPTDGPPDPPENPFRRWY
jgi:hypothetical protein